MTAPPAGRPQLGLHLLADRRLLGRIIVIKKILVHLTFICCFSLKGNFGLKRVKRGRGRRKGEGGGRGRCSFNL